MSAVWTPAEQPDSFVFDAAAEEEIAGVLSKYPQERKASAVMPLLYIAQRQMGRVTGSAWVPVVAMDVIAQRLDKAAMRVYEVASVYTRFNTRPIGRYHLQGCTTTQCWLHGDDEEEEDWEKATGIQQLGRE